MADASEISPWSHGVAASCASVSSRVVALKAAICGSRRRSASLTPGMTTAKLVEVLMNTVRFLIPALSLGTR